MIGEQQQETNISLGVVNAVPCVSLAGCHAPIEGPVALLSLNWTEERKCNKRIMCQDKDWEKSVPYYYHRPNRLDWGKNLFNSLL